MKHLLIYELNRTKSASENIDYEIANFRTNTIPLYVKMDAEGMVIGETKGTDLDIQSYLSWLKAGTN